MREVACEKLQNFLLAPGKPRNQKPRNPETRNQKPEIPPRNYPPISIKLVNHH